ncbi:hypothetical protein [Microbulbifer sp. PAAF003]|uniref:hypothetical protein n=1 Tax=Microbulbifer sp. PAAF003 TaxID=3243375 RepID=UPI004039EE45
MTKVRNKLTTVQKREKAERQKKYMWVFMSGKQVRVKRPPTIDGMDVDMYIERNADPIWLHENGMREVLHAREMDESNDDIF